MQTRSFALTKNEREIMELLWQEDRPLSRTEIIVLSPDKSWKASSIHILLNQLLDKEAIKVDGFVQTGKNFGRTFAFALSEEDYQVMQFQASLGYRKSKKNALLAMVSALIEKEVVDCDTIDRLSALLEAKRKELK